MTEPGTARAWGWLAHLREGGTTPWEAWAATAEPAGARLPGTQQLELLRRLNAVRRPSADLVERVLAADPSRRTRPGLPLLGGPPDPEYGPRAVPPAGVRAEELIDLAAVVIALELAAQRPPDPPTGIHRPWAIRYHLHGDPELARAVRRHLVAHGRPPATHGGRSVVLAADVGRMLADLWTHRALAEGVVTWTEWWRRRAGADRLPGPVDLLGGVAAGGRRPGVRAIHLVTDPVLAPRFLGLRRPMPPPEPMAAAAVDLGRRVVGALRPVLPPPERRAVVSELLRPRLAALPGPPLVVPAAHRPWVDAQASRLVQRLRRESDRYRVHGDLEQLRPVDRPGAEVIRPRATLGAAVELLLAADTAAVEEGP